MSGAITGWAIRLAPMEWANGESYQVPRGVYITVTGWAGGATARVYVDGTGGPALSTMRGAMPLGPGQILTADGEVCLYGWRMKVDTA